MKKTIVVIIGILILVFAFAKINSSHVEKAISKLEKQTLENIQDGDIIFQTSESSQCEAVRIATNSIYSHCGIVYNSKGKKYVYEAVQPVKITPFEEWISHGKNNDYLIKRIKKSETQLTTSQVEKMKQYALTMMSKDYDLYFEWSDDKIYCSELVWKVYKHGVGIELCELEKLKSFNLNDPKVKAILQERYGNKIPVEEEVVAPSQLVNSNLLETVIDTY
jgi:uncharacterized protein YycO